MRPSKRRWIFSGLGLPAGRAIVRRPPPADPAPDPGLWYVGDPAATVLKPLLGRLFGAHLRVDLVTPLELPWFEREIAVVEQPTVMLDVALTAEQLQHFAQVASHANKRLLVAPPPILAPGRHPYSIQASAERVATLWHMVH